MRTAKRKFPGCDQKWRALVAQIFNLLCRRVALGRASASPPVRLPQRLRIPDPRYGRVQLGATSAARSGRDQERLAGRVGLRDGRVVAAAVRRLLAESPEEFDPRAYLKPARDAMQQVVMERMAAFGQAGHAGDYAALSLAEMAERYRSA